MGSEIEQLPDLSGYLKLASRPAWQRVYLRAPGSQLRSQAVSGAASILRFQGKAAGSTNHSAAISMADQQRATGHEDIGLE
jgi:hypothetical protein